jgi:hypothetical protein
MKYWLYNSHLEEGEEILFVVHRHWLVLKKKIWKASTFGVLPPVVLFYFFPAFWPVFAIWFSIGVFAYFMKFLEWAFDCLLVTNLGVIDIERKGIFDNTSKRLEYETIDGVSYTLKGFLPTVLNYGDIIVDKMGSDISINLDDAANPKVVSKKIMECQEKYINGKSFTDHEALKSMLADMIATHVKKYGVKPLDKSKAASIKNKILS